MGITFQRVFVLAEVDAVFCINPIVGHVHLAWFFTGTISLKGINTADQSSDLWGTLKATVTPAEGDFGSDPEKVWKEKFDMTHLGWARLSCPFHTI